MAEDLPNGKYTITNAYNSFARVVLLKNESALLCIETPCSGPLKPNYKWFLERIRSEKKLYLIYSAAFNCAQYASSDGAPTSGNQIIGKEKHTESWELEWVFMDVYRIIVDGFVWSSNDGEGENGNIITLAPPSQNFDERQLWRINPTT